MTAQLNPSTIRTRRSQFRSDAKSSTAFRPMTRVNAPTPKPVPRYVTASLALAYLSILVGSCLIAVFWHTETLQAALGWLRGLA